MFGSKMKSWRLKFWMNRRTCKRYWMASSRSNATKWQCQCMLRLKIWEVSLDKRDWNLKGNNKLRKTHILFMLTQRHRSCMVMATWKARMTSLSTWWTSSMRQMDKCMFQVWKPRMKPKEVTPIPSLLQNRTEMSHLTQSSIPFSWSSTSSAKHVEAMGTTTTWEHITTSKLTQRAQKSSRSPLHS